MTGEVKSYNPSTRYGFITAGGVDYRFHNASWGLRLPPTKGMKVQFLQVESEKGMRAVCITKGEVK